jgi:hypothetical protein
MFLLIKSTQDKLLEGYKKSPFLLSARNRVTYIGLLFKITFTYLYIP